MSGILNPSFQLLASFFFPGRSSAGLIGCQSRPQQNESGTRMGSLWGGLLDPAHRMKRQNSCGFRQEGKSAVDLAEGHAVMKQLLGSSW